MKWVNEIVKYLLCMKYVEDSLVGWSTMNIPFSEIETCICVIAALPLNLVIAY